MESTQKENKTSKELYERIKVRIETSLFFGEEGRGGIIMNDVDDYVNTKLSELEKELEKVSEPVKYFPPLRGEKEQMLLDLEDAKTIINKYKENGKA